MTELTTAAAAPAPGAAAALGAAAAPGAAAGARPGARRGDAAVFGARLPTAAVVAPSFREVRA
ncbi:hypothetical protein Amsp01_077720 [Amycolatopsis sp. NBRC 101858]|uniref:hypothetical protein n=1 Tax=Amycolatopsis sp. NBRC 101858 TaxID=3032200 RepID=UPI0024A1EE3D|nr:hypothetical protein [Amycolatopsis sp. NBRC 101858]GLY41749.1 hypothetical protein Amsp01_077720 [Amycolatopsis sp. NBRC 101858]